MKHIEFFRLASRYEKSVPIVITLVAVLIAYALPQADIINLIIFVVLIIVFSVYRFDSRILIAYAILLLVIAGALTFLKSEYSNQIAVISYWLISAGVICLIINLYRGRKNVGIVT